MCIHIEPTSEGIRRSLLSPRYHSCKAKQSSPAQLVHSVWGKAQWLSYGPKLTSYRIDGPRGRGMHRAQMELSFGPWPHRRWRTFLKRRKGGHPIWEVSFETACNQHGNPYLVFVAHDWCALVGSQLKVVDSPREIEWRFQLGSHLVSRYFAPHMGLSPMHPGSAHLKRVSSNIRGPWSPADAIACFD